MKKILSLLCFVFILSACSSDDDKGEPRDYQKLVQGVWVSKEGEPQEEYEFVKDKVFYKEYHTGNNSGYGSFYTIDEKTIAIPTQKLKYSYAIKGAELMLSNSEETHNLIKSK